MNDIDIKIFELISILKQLKTIRSKQQFWDSLGMLRQNGDKIKKGLAHFTPRQMKLICKIYNVNANWIVDVELNIFRTQKENILPKTTAKV